MPHGQPSLFDPANTAPAPASAPPTRKSNLNPSTPLAVAFESWLDHLRKQDISFHTFTAFKCDVNILLEHLDQIGRAHV